MYGLLNHNARELIATQQGMRKTKRVRLSRRFKQRIYWRDGGRCVYCDRVVAFKDVTMDHVTPLTKRGSNRSKENIVTSCKLCNKRKGSLELETLDDLSPEALWMKFDKTVRDAQTRKGHFAQIASTY